MMNLDTIRNRLLGPFKPFTLHLTDGRKISVPHPDFIMVGRGVVVILDEHDVDHVVDALHIVSVEDRILQN